MARFEKKKSGRKKQWEAALNKVWEQDHKALCAPDVELNNRLISDGDLLESFSDIDHKKRSSSETVDVIKSAFCEDAYKVIQNVNMQENFIGSEGAVKLSEYLRAAPELSHVNLNYNWITDSGFFWMLINVIACGNKMVEHLSFAGNIIDFLEVSELFEQASSFRDMFLSSIATSNVVINLEDNPIAFDEFMNFIEMFEELAANNIPINIRIILSPQTLLDGVLSRKMNGRMFPQVFTTMVLQPNLTGFDPVKQAQYHARVNNVLDFSASFPSLKTIGLFRVRKQIQAGELSVNTLSEKLPEELSEMLLGYDRAQATQVNDSNGTAGLSGNSHNDEVSTTSVPSPRCK